MSQELLKGIIYIINNVSDVQIKREALYTLDIIIDKKCTQMSDDELQEVIKCIFNYIKKCGCDLHGLQCFYRILSTERNFVVDGDMMAIIMSTIIRIDSDENVIGLSMQILTMLTMINIEYLCQFLEFLVVNKVKLSKVINEVVSIPKLYSISKKYLAIVGLIVASEIERVKSYLEFDDILNNLVIPRLLSL